MKTTRITCTTPRTNGIQIYLFGSLQIVHTLPLPIPPISRSAETLLAYLLLQQRRTVQREVLLELFWDEQDRSKARGRLNTMLWRLRHILEPEGIARGTYLITTSSGEIGFNWESEHWVDTLFFEHQLGSGLAQAAPDLDHAAIQRFKSALGLYTADMLEGVYEDWAIRERERLRLLHIGALAHLMYYNQYHGAYAESIEYGKQILAHDPLREDIHREMMRLYMANGQRVLAVQQYETCRDILAADLSLDPMPETQSLYAQIACVQGEEPSVSAGTELREALQQLRKAMRICERSQELLQRAIRLVERSI